ncbi:MAG: rod shape-determining protein MreD [Gammaproteobacteria bacterium]|nr:rod shape-determining protein MreD [Gammaproteobacteria bacterium]MDH4315919.1 rod shape-determining protein MreD [Gammaproteobacteria bacterium]MDH5214139.1 rod shape-determining protein MreD [Gammaproteobacteria bacterium]MDH5500097.1 rod shape-determining protein MreD [Gammaproteobacteria bacterium]
MSKDRSARRLPVVFSIVVALMLSMVPLPDVIDPYRPDWVALTLIYWAMTLPRSYSVGTAWVVGIVLDIAHGTLLGQYALAMCFMIYVTAKFHLQLRVFPLSQMTATVFALLSLYQFLLFWINGVAGLHTEAVSYWGPVLTGTALWPLLSTIFGGIRYRVRASS